MKDHPDWINDQQGKRLGGKMEECRMAPQTEGQNEERKEQTELRVG